MGKKLSVLAKLVQGEVIGDKDVEVTGVGGADNAREDQITFAQTEDFFTEAQKRARAIIVSPELADEDSSKPLIVVDNPRLAFAEIANEFMPQPYYKPGISKAAEISNKAKVGSNVSIHPGVVIEEGAEVGDGVILAPGVYVGKNVKIKEESILHPSVIIEHDCKIGAGVEINAGAVIGSEGYGFETCAEGHVKVPQFGDVIIEDEVEIGANVTVDRAATGSTVVGEGTKIDNLVHIAHNVKIGARCLIIAQVGISGSVDIEEEVTLAGKSGVAGHLTIGNNTTVAAASIVTHDIDPDSFVSGYPAHDHRAERRAKVARKKLPEIIKRMRKLEKRVVELEEKLDREDQE